MLRLRPYKACDAQKIVTWLKDEDIFRKWGGSRFGTFPLTPEMMNDKYLNHNGDCMEEDNFYPMTAVDDREVVGHFIMRYLHGDPKILRFGWVVVDASKRGSGYGVKMLTLGLRFAFEILQVEKVTIGVFENNAPAYGCYKKIGFHEAPMEKEVFETFGEEKWKLVELEITGEDYGK